MGHNLFNIDFSWLLKYFISDTSCVCWVDYMRDFIEVNHITDSEKEFVSDKNQKKDWKNYIKKKINSDYGLSSYLS